MAQGGNKARNAAPALFRPGFLPKRPIGAQTPAHPNPFPHRQPQGNRKPDQRLTGDQDFFGTHRISLCHSLASEFRSKKRNPQVSLGVSVVGAAGIEPATPAMSTQCSPTELRAHFRHSSMPDGCVGYPPGQREREVSPKFRDDKSLPPLPARKKEIRPPSSWHRVC